MKTIPVRYRAIGGAVSIAVVLAALLFLALGRGGSAPAPLTIEGVSLAEAEGNGIFLTVPDGESAKITADEATAKAPGKVNQAVLAHLTDENIEPNLDQLVWILIMDPESHPLSGDADYMGLYMNVVDATTGDWLYGYGEEVSCDQTPETMAECKARGITPKLLNP